MKARIRLLLWFQCCILSLYADRLPYYHLKQLSIREGLPSSVTSLYDDQNGALWIGTTQGVYRFNGTRIKKYPLPTPLRQGTHYISKIQGDNQNRTWVFTTKGVSYHEKGQDSLRTLLYRRRAVKASTLLADGDEVIIPTTDTLLTYSKDLSLTKTLPLKSSGTYIFELLRYDTRHYLALTSRWELKIIDKYTGELTSAPFSESTNVYCLYQDNEKSYWISYYGKGVKRYEQAGKLLAEYHTGNSDLSNDIVLDIKEWDKSIWLATDGGGVNVIYPETGEVEVLSTQTNRDFPANSVACLLRSDNHMWIGMVREGVLGVEKGFITTYTTSVPNQPSGLSEKCPLYLWEDTDGTIWIGTDGGGINRFDPDTELFTHYPRTFGEKIVSICPLTESTLLVSSFSKGLYLFNKKTGDYHRFVFPDRSIEEKLVGSGSPINLRVNSKKEIELYGSSVYRYLPSEHRMEPIIVNLKPLNTSWVYIGDHRSNPLFHDRSKVFRHNVSTKQFEMVFYEKDNQIMAADLDSSGILWIAGPNGVSRIHPDNGQKEDIKLPDGNDVITSLIADRDGVIWMGSLGVVYAYDSKKNHFIIYSEMDGVLPNDFLSKPVLETADGNIYMGGSEGLLRINKPLRPSTGLQLAAPVLQEVFLDGAAVAVAPSLELRVPHHFSSLYIHVQLKGADVFRKRIFRFRIKGLNDEYIETAQPFLSLHTLSPGDYRITTQCTQNDGSWSEESVLLDFEVMPPWWKQIWFIALCIGAGILLLVTLIHTHNRRMKHKLQEEERKIYKEKVRALININHELRTPLTLIYSPLKQLLNSRRIPREQQIKVQSAFKQARQMKNIIDMILNMRKMEVEENILRMSSTALNDWIRAILDDFREEFSMREITLGFEPDENIEEMYFDRNQCEIIINNLLTNAYKFSEEHSTVTVSTHLEEEGKYIRIAVKDEGEGLREEEIGHLFTRFYQGQHNIQGSGIGLSYAKQLVEMHGGSIGAKNNEGKGACFFFTLPYRRESTHIKSVPQAYLNAVAPPEEEQQVRIHNGSDNQEKFHSILIVEDDRDLCHYLICHLQSVFKEVYEAHDGIEALPIIASRTPQLVLSDVRMPRMNGFELCRYIKQKPEMNYIPVILLTSCVDDAGMEEAFKLGAEAYVTKPFDMDLLLIQIQNILKNQKIVKKHYATIDIPEEEREELIPADEHFIIQLNRIINENIGNGEMDVNFIARQMGMSRASLYNKTKRMMKTGVNEHIIKCRMEHACRLLETTHLSINDVAEQCGFRHSRNFSTLFKNTFGESPSDYRKKKR
ncbi:ATP-binding protein [Bacteroides pyogenes]|uniref:ATP-binding protein n=1 Tax=Bacteroides pyogenes TaxID=310300 RepID=UPI002FDA53D2